MKLRTLLISAVSALVASVLVVGAQVPNISSTLNSVFTLAYEVSTAKATYSAVQGFAVPTTATDVCTLTGSATKTVRLRRILLSGGATAVATEPVQIIKRSTINVGANVISMTKVPYDSAYVASTAAWAEAWTAAPTTLGTAVGTIADPVLTFNNYTTGVGSGNVAVEFGQFGSPVVLRGIAQNVSVNLMGVVPAGVFLTCTFEWTEDTDS